MEEDDASVVLDSAHRAILPPATPDPAKAAPMLIQRWMHQGITQKKTTPKSPQKKPGSQNKREMIDPPLPSYSTPYPSGTQVFSPGISGKGDKAPAAQAILGGPEEGEDVTSPPCMVGRYRGLLNARLAKADLPLLGTPLEYTLMFPDRPARPHLMNFDSSQDQDGEEGSAGALLKIYAEVLAMTPIRLHPGSHIPPPQAPPPNPTPGKCPAKPEEG